MLFLFFCTTPEFLGRSHTFIRTWNVTKTLRFIDLSSCWHLFLTVLLVSALGYCSLNCAEHVIHRICFMFICWRRKVSLCLNIYTNVTWTPKASNRQIIKIDSSVPGGRRFHSLPPHWSPSTSLSAVSLAESHVTVDLLHFVIFFNCNSFFFRTTPHHQHRGSPVMAWYAMT